MRELRLSVDQRRLLRQVLEKRQPDLVWVTTDRKPLIDGDTRDLLGEILVEEMLTTGLTGIPNAAELSAYGRALDDLVGAIVDPV